MFHIETYRVRSSRHPLPNCWAPEGEVSASIKVSSGLRLCGTRQSNLAIRHTVLHSLTNRSNTFFLIESGFKLVQSVVPSIASIKKHLVAVDQRRRTLRIQMNSPVNDHVLIFGYDKCYIAKNNKKLEQSSYSSFSSYMALRSMGDSPGELGLSEELVT